MARSCIFIVLFLILLLQGNAIFAQQTDSAAIHQNDTIPTSSRPDTIPGTSAAVEISADTVTHAPQKSVLGLDTLGKKYNPKRAMMRSAILPGWGQWTNKKYWKIPIIYGALGVSAGVFFYNLKTYRLLRQAVIYRASGTHADSMRVDPQFVYLSTQSIRLYRNAYRQNIDYSVLAFLVLWGLNVVDATVDAHLKAFDVSPDIGLKIRAGFNYTTSNAGISLVFFFKEKSTKHVLPLP